MVLLVQDKPQLRINFTDRRPVIKRTPAPRPGFEAASIILSFNGLLIHFICPHIVDVSPLQTSLRLKNIHIPCMPNSWTNRHTPPSFLAPFIIKERTRPKVYTRLRQADTYLGHLAFIIPHKIFEPAL